MFFRTALKKPGADLKNYESGKSIPAFMFNALSLTFRSTNPVGYIESQGPGRVTDLDDVKEALQSRWTQTCLQSFPKTTGTECYHPLFDASKPFWFDDKADEKIARQSKDMRMAILATFSNVQGQTSAAFYAFVQKAKAHQDSLWQRALSQSGLIESVCDRRSSRLSGDFRQFAGHDGSLIFQARQNLAERDGHEQQATVIFGQETFALRFSMSGRLM